MSTQIEAFVSYSWDNREHQEWVHEFTNKLRDSGIDATFDKFVIQDGELNLNKMMIQNMRKDYIIMILTKNYAKKANEFEGGVGYETLLSLPVIQKTPQKIILINKESNDISSAIPDHLEGAYYFDFSDHRTTNEKFDELIHRLHKIDYWAKRPVGNIPKKIKDKMNKEFYNSNTKTHFDKSNILEDETEIIIGEDWEVENSEEELNLILEEIEFKKSNMENNDSLFTISLKVEEIIEKTMKDKLSNSNNNPVKVKGLQLENLKIRQQIDLKKSELSDVVNIFFDNLYVNGYTKLLDERTTVFRKCLGYISNSKRLSTDVVIDVYHFVEKESYFRIYLSKEEWDMLSLDQKNSSQIYGMNFVTELPIEIIKYNVIPAYIMFLQKNFIEKNKEIPSHCKNLQGNWFFGLA